MDLGIPAFKIKNLLESDPVTSIFLVRALAAVARPAPSLLEYKAAVRR